MLRPKHLVSSLPALACVAVLAAGTPLHAQETTGTIRGTVRDSSGAPVAGATVTVINSATGIQTRKLVTNGSGEYVAPLLPVGTYEIDAETAGFKRYAERGVVVNVADRLEKNLKLAVGEASDTVEVSSSLLGVQTENANAESLISGEQVRALPTNNRNYEQLVALQPGVSGNVPDQLYVGVYNYKNQTNVASFSVGGGRDSQNNWTIDGADNVDRGSNKTIPAWMPLKSSSCCEGRTARSMAAAQPDRLKWSRVPAGKTSTAVCMSSFAMTPWTREQCL